MKGEFISSSNDGIALIHSKQYTEYVDEKRPTLVLSMQKIKENLKSIDMRIIFNVEIIKDLLSSREFELLAKHVKEFDLKIRKIDIHVTPDDFSNFILTDRELIQPSFDPSNKLIGSYLSRNSSIYKIFDEKFNELFENGISIEQFLKEHKDLEIKALDQSQKFVLCIL